MAGKWTKMVEKLKKLHMNSKEKKIHGKNKVKKKKNWRKK